MARVSLFIMTLLITVQVQAAAVWKVSLEENVMYLGGTLHLLSETDYPLPDEYEAAYGRSDILVFETDLDAASSPEFQQRTLQLMTYTDGTSIQDALSADTFQALTDHLKKRNLPLINFLSFKPSMMSLSLSLIEMQRIGLTSAGVDQYYVDKAKADGKSMLFLETPAQQLAFLASLGAEDGDALVRYTLRDLKDLPAMLDSMKSFWRAGDMPGMAETSIGPLKQDYPDVYRDLLVTRNQNWLPQLTRMLDTPQTEFVLVGALHLAGPDSVLADLQSAGYRIEKLSENQE